jgi:hypothetical protein
MLEEKTGDTVWNPLIYVKKIKKKLKFNQICVSDFFEKLKFDQICVLKNHGR